MLSSATVVALGASTPQSANLTLSSNDARDLLSFHLTISNRLSLSSNDHKDTTSFTLSCINSFTLNSTDHKDTLAFTLTPVISLGLITNDALDIMKANFFTPPNTTVILPAQLDLSITIEEITYNNRWGYLA